MSSFTYSLPDPQSYQNAIVRMLAKRDEYRYVSEILKRSTCTVDAPGGYGSRWDARRATVYFYVPFEDLDTFDNNALRTELLALCDKLMPKNAGFDVMQLEIVPRLDDQLDDQPEQELPDMASTTTDSTIEIASHFETAVNMDTRHVPAAGTSDATKVFISYTWDSPQHSDRTLEVADRLRSLGVDANLDQYEESPPEGWPRWMVNQIDRADYVVVICTQTYDRRFRGKEQPGKGLGGTWEGGVITQEIYDASGMNSKFIPCVFDAASLAFIPVPLRGATHYNLSADEDFQKLYRRITGQQATVRPSLGEIKVLPVRERKQTSSATTVAHESAGVAAAQLRAVDLDLLQQISHVFTGSAMRLFIENIEESGIVYTDQVSAFDESIRLFRSVTKRFREPSLEAAKVSFLDSLARFLSFGGTTFFPIGAGRAKFYGGISEYQLMTSHAKSYPEDYQAFIRLARAFSKSWHAFVEKALQLAPDYNWPD